MLQWMIHKFLFFRRVFINQVFRLFLKRSIVWDVIICFWVGQCKISLNSLDWFVALPSTSSWSISNLYYEFFMFLQRGISFISWWLVSIRTLNRFLIWLIIFLLILIQQMFLFLWTLSRQVWCWHICNGVWFGISTQNQLYVLFELEVLQIVM